MSQSLLGFLPPFVKHEDHIPLPPGQFNGQFNARFNHGVDQRRTVMKVRTLLMCAVTTASAVFVGADQNPPVFVQTGSSLYQLCAGSADAADVAACDGYIAGVTDSLTLFRAFLRDADQLGIMEVPTDLETRAICFSERVTTDQLRQLVIESLRDHPELRHLPGSTLVHGALLQEFACAPEVD